MPSKLLNTFVYCAVAALLFSVATILADAFTAFTDFPVWELKMVLWISLIAFGVLQIRRVYVGLYRDGLGCLKRWNVANDVEEESVAKSL